MQLPRSIFVGINGGHHRSTALGYDPSSGRFFSVRGAPINCHSSASDHVCGRLSSLIDNLISETESLPAPVVVERLVLAVPGAISFREERAQGIHQQLVASLNENDRLGHWQVIDDTWAGLYAEIGEPNGICGYASAGTSVCIAPGEFVADKKYKIDGWGPIIGDFGSAFDIVVDYFRQLGRRLDRNEDSVVFQGVRDFANSYRVFTMARREDTATLPTLVRIADVQEWFDELCNRFKNGEWRSVFAALARPILEHADTATPSDHEAYDIVVDNARRFSDSILIAVNGDDNLPVTLQGGLVRNCRTYRDAVIKCLADEGVEAKLARSKTVVGSLMLAIDGLSDESGVWRLQPPNTCGVKVRDKYLESISTHATSEAV